MSQSTFGGPDSMMPVALLSDTAHMFRQLGVESIRASVANLSSMALHPTWTISDLGETNDDSPERPMDSAFPGSADVVAQLAAAPANETVVQRLSPRLWLCAWRLDHTHAVMVEAKYREPRDGLDEHQQTLMRLVCNTGIRARLMSTTPLLADEPMLQWPSVERRHTGGPTRRHLATLALVAAGALVSLWLALVALPGAQDKLLTQQADVNRLHAIVDNAMLGSLATAMATGDYGEVQTALSSFESLGCVQRAVVTNGRLLNVAQVGPSGGLSIGKPVPANLAQAARKLDLTIGTQHFGQLLLLREPRIEGMELRFDILRLAAGFAFLASALAAAVMAIRWRKSPLPGTPSAPPAVS
jgi:hypothetical protein